MDKRIYRGYDLADKDGRVHVSKDGEAKADFASEMEAQQWVDSTVTQAGRKPQQSTAAEENVDPAKPGEHAERAPGRTPGDIETR